MGMKERGKIKGCTGSNEEKEKGGELGKELNIGYVSILYCENALLATI